MAARIGQAAAVWLALLAGAAQAEGTLRELATADAVRGWEAVGRIDIGSSGFCTGTLIASDLVLTAAHCLYDPDTGAPVALADFRFLPGWRNGRAEAYRGVRQAVQHPAYAFGSPDRIERVAHDVALLVLDQPIRTTAVQPLGTSEPPRAGQTVAVVSYAEDRDAAPSLEEACKVVASGQGVIMADCDVDFGSSGAPILRVVDGEPLIVSVVSAKADREASSVALGADISETLSVVRAGLTAASAGLPRVRSGLGTGLAVGADRAAGAGGSAKFVRP